jgi:hypothetical protein
MAERRQPDILPEGCIPEVLFSCDASQVLLLRARSLTWKILRDGWSWSGEQVQRATLPG